MVCRWIGGKGGNLWELDLVTHMWLENCTTLKSGELGNKHVY